MKTVADLVKEDNQSQKLTQGFVIFMIIVYAILCYATIGFTAMPFTGVGTTKWIISVFLLISLGCLWYFTLIKNKLWSFSKNYKWNRILSDGKTRFFDTDGTVFVKKRSTADND